MSRDTKLSVEKVLEKLRRTDKPFNEVLKKEKIAELDDEIAQIRSQRARLRRRRQERDDA